MRCKIGDVKFSDRHIAPGYLLWRLANLWQKFMREKLDALDITHVQFALLKALYWEMEEKEKSVTQVELANVCSMDVMMTSQVVRTLEKKKLVERAQHPHDTRAKVLILTPEGKKVIRKAFDFVSDLNDQFFKPVEKRLPRIVAVMQKIIDANEKLLQENQNHE